MCTEEKIYKTKADEMKDGTFAAFYTEKYFCKVKQALGIDKVHFAFVEIGKQGAGIDIYVDVDDFDNLCDEIMTGRLLQKMKESTSSYPDSWKYATGTDASKKLAIGKGSKTPVVVQGRDTKAEKNIFIGVMSYDELRSMAKWWKRISKKYFEELVEVCLSASNNRPSKEDLIVSKEQAPKSESGVKNGKPEELVKIRVIATRECKEREKFPGNFAMSGKNFENDEQLNIVFEKNEIANMSKNTWEAILERSGNKEVPLDFTAFFVERVENERKVYIFRKFEK